MPRKSWRRPLANGSKVLILGALLVVFFSPFGKLIQTPNVSASHCPAGYEHPGGATPIPGSTICIKSEGSGPVLDSSGNPVQAGDDCGGSIACWIANIVYVFTVGLGSVVAYIGALIFNLATVLTLNSTAYALTFLSDGWSIVRDIANMFFILILVYIALTVMLRADTSDTMRKLAWVIAIALVINFSFFFVRVVIDAGNLLAVQFYNAIEAPTIGQTNVETDSVVSGVATAASSYLGQANLKDLTAGIMNGIGAQQILNTESFQNFREDPNGGFLTELITLIVIYLALGVILFILAAAFFTVGIKFIVRTGVLWFVLIAAPLALIARTVPQGREFYFKWQNMLIHHAFYPAVFLFIFYVLTLFMGELTEGKATILEGTFGTAQKYLSQEGSGLTALVPIIAHIGIKLGFVIAILYIGLQAAEKMGVMGATLARNVTGRAFGIAGGAAGLTTGLLGRRVLGQPAYNLAQTARLRGAQPTFTGRLWRGIDRVSRPLSTASFDLRNAPGSTLVRRGADAVVGKGAINVGKPNEGGVAQQIKEKDEKERKQRQERAAIMRETALKDAVSRVGTGQATTADEDRIKNSSKNDFNNLKGADIERIAHLLNESKQEWVKNHEKLNDAEKDAILKIADPIAKSQKIVVDELRKLNNTLRSGISANVVATHTAKGQLIDSAKVAAMQQDVRSQIKTLEKSVDQSPSESEKNKLQHDLNQLHNALNSLRELNTNLGKAQAHAGNSAGTIIAS